MAVALLLATVSGCRRAAPPAPSSLSKTVERGPFRLTATVTPRQVWVGDPLTIELEVETPEDALVKFPKLPDLGDLQIRSVKTADPHPGVKGGLVWRRTIRAEPLASGVVELPAFSVKYGRKSGSAPEVAAGSGTGRGGPVFDHELEVEPLRVEVRSALTTQDSVVKPRDITGILLPPAPPLGFWAWAAIVGGGLLAALGLAALVVWLRRRARRPAPPIPPEVWALRALAKLEAQNLVERGAVREFYYSLSEIVRKYIEDKFGLAAPEMTTEEFLSTLARSDRALPWLPSTAQEQWHTGPGTDQEQWYGSTTRLGRFLAACDLVKYAAYLPGPDDAQQALGTARAFIDATAAAGQQRAAPVATPRSGPGEEYAA